MPRYVYHCTNCDSKIQASHSISEELKDCDSCSSESTLRRIPQTSFIVKKKANKGVGKIVEKNISESKKELEDMKERMREKL